MLLFDGSSSTWLTPRIVAFPSQTNENVAPPSVDLNSPNGGLGGGGVVVAPPVTEATPRTPRVDETYRMFALLGSTTILLIERPSNASPLYVPFPGVVHAVTCDARCVQVLPPSVDL